MQVTVELRRRYPTAKLAAWEVQFLPSCGWKPVLRDGYYRLQFKCDEIKARHILGYLKAELRTVHADILETEQPTKTA